MSDYATEMAERAVQNFSDAYFKEVVLPKGGPITHLLARSRIEAADALLMLITANADEPGVVKDLQNKVRLHVQLLRWCSETVAQGEEIYDRLKIEEREDMQLAILTRSGGDTTMVDE